MPIKYFVYSASWPDAPAVGGMDADAQVGHVIGSLAAHPAARAAGFNARWWKAFRASADGKHKRGDALDADEPIDALARDDKLRLWVEAPAPTLTDIGASSDDGDDEDAKPALKPWPECRMAGDRTSLPLAPVPVELTHHAFLVFRLAAQEPVDLRSAKFASAASAAELISSFPKRGTIVDADEYAEQVRQVIRILLPGTYVGGMDSRAPVLPSPDGSTDDDLNTFFATTVDCKRLPDCILLTGKVAFDEYVPVQNDVFAYQRVPLIDNGTGSLCLPRALHDHERRLPLFLLDVSGGHIAEVRAGVWLGGCLCTETVGIATLNSAPGSSERRRLVSLFYALAEGLKELRDCYEAADAACTDPDDLVPINRVPPVHTFIHPRIIAEAAPPGCTIELTGHEQRNVFYGIMSSAGAAGSAGAASAAGGAALVPVGAGAAAGSGTSSSAGGSAASAGMPVVVKFCREYAADVHAAAASAGHAPVLHAAAEAPGWRVVIMDRLHPDQWRRLSDFKRGDVADGDLDALESSVLAAYRKAFAGKGAERLVHGDARAANIFVRKAPAPAGTADAAVAPVATGAEGADAAATGASAAAGSAAMVSTDATAATAPAGSATAAVYDVMFIDFDIAGKEGAVCYPLGMSRSAFRPVVNMIAAGAAAGAPATGQLGGMPILQAYDEALIRAVITGEGGGRA